MMFAVAREVQALDKSASPSSTGEFRENPFVSFTLEEWVRLRDRIKLKKARMADEQDRRAMNMSRRRAERDARTQRWCEFAKWLHEKLAIDENSDVADQGRVVLPTGKLMSEDLEARVRLMRRAAGLEVAQQHSKSILGGGIAPGGKSGSAVTVEQISESSVPTGVATPKVGDWQIVSDAVAGSLDGFSKKSSAGSDASGVLVDAEKDTETTDRESIRVNDVEQADEDLDDAEYDVCDIDLRTAGHVRKASGVQSRLHVTRRSTRSRSDRSKTDSSGQHGNNKLLRMRQRTAARDEKFYDIHGFGVFGCGKRSTGHAASARTAVDLDRMRAGLRKVAAARDPGLEHPLLTRLRCARPRDQLPIRPILSTESEGRSARGHWVSKIESESTIRADGSAGAGKGIEGRQPGPWCMKFDPYVMSMWATEEIAELYQAFVQEKYPPKVHERRSEKRSARERELARLRADGTAGADGTARATATPAVPDLLRGVGSLFATGLLQEYIQPTTESLSGLHAKWAPTPNGKHDKATGIVDDVLRAILASWPDSVLKKLFSVELLRNYGKITSTRVNNKYYLVRELRTIFGAVASSSSTESAEEQASSEESSADRAARYATFRKLARQVYHRDLLALLRRKAEIPEHFVGKQELHLVNYARMSSLCRSTHGISVFRKGNPRAYDRGLLEALRDQLSAVMDHCPTDGTNNGPGQRRGKVRHIHATQLLPNDIIRDLTLNSPKKPQKMLELLLAWQTHVATLRAKMQSQNLLFIPMADVSGSMEGLPMEVCVALSLLLAEATPRRGPLSAFRGKVLTFDHSPQWYDLCSRAMSPGKARMAGRISDEDGADAQFTFLSLLDGMIADLDESSGVPLDDIAKRAVLLLEDMTGNVAARADYLKKASWGGSTDVHAAFDRILELLVQENKDPRGQLPSTKICLVVFSDMEFDQAAQPHHDDTAYERVCTKFRDAGFVQAPQIAFWNLRDSKSVPVGCATERGVALFSGFSAQMLGNFMEGLGEELVQKRTAESSGDSVREQAKEKFNPRDRMMAAISGPLYDGIPKLGSLGREIK